MLVRRPEVAPVTLWVTGSVAGIFGSCVFALTHQRAIQGFRDAGPLVRAVLSLAFELMMPSSLPIIPRALACLGLCAGAIVCLFLHFALAGADKSISWWMLSSGACAGLLVPRMGALFRELIGRRADVPAIRIVRECAAVSAIALLAAIILYPSILGDRLVNRDHQLHFQGTWETLRKIRAGGVHGWSNALFAGYPVNYLYPFGAHLWVLALYAGGFGWLPLAEAYAYAIWLFYAFLGWSVYFWARTLTSRGAAFAAALLFLWDDGAFRVGGARFTLYYGVWPQALALAFGLCSLVWLQRMVKGDLRPAASATFALCVGCALLSHPTMLLFYPLAIGTLGVTLLRFPPSVSARSLFLRIFVGLLMGSCIAAIWIIPLFATSAYATEYGAPWMNMSGVAEELVRMDLIGETARWMTAFGLIGLFAWFFSGRFEQCFAALLAFTFLMFSAGDFSYDVVGSLIGAKINYIQFERFRALARPFFFAGACSLFGAIFVHLRSTVPEPIGGRAADRFGVILWQMAAGALVFPIFFAFGATFIRTTGPHLPLMTEHEDPVVKQEREMLEYLETHAAATRSGFFRIAYDTSREDGTREDGFVDFEGFYPTFGRPIYRLGRTPVQIFRYTVSDMGGEALKALSVRYVITSSPRSRGDLRLMKTAGRLYIYEFEPWDPSPFAIVHGEAAVRVKEFSDERIALEVTASAPGTLRLNVSYFPRWTATIDGSAVTIRPIKLPGVDKTGFMSVPLRSGIYEFTFRPNALDRFAACLSICAVLLTLFLFAVGRRARARAAGLETHEGSAGARDREMVETERMAPVAPLEQREK